jgi:hypothetical protein
MLLSELVLSKRGPLAKIWLSAHHERKLTKQQTLNVDIEDSCGTYCAPFPPLADKQRPFSASRTMILSPFGSRDSSC